MSWPHNELKRKRKSFLLTTKRYCHQVWILFPICSGRLDGRTAEVGAKSGTACSILSLSTTCLWSSSTFFFSGPFSRDLFAWWWRWKRATSGYRRHTQGWVGPVGSIDSSRLVLFLLFLFYLFIYPPTSIDGGWSDSIGLDSIVGWMDRVNSD